MNTWSKRSRKSVILVTCDSCVDAIQKARNSDNELVAILADCPAVVRLVNIDALIEAGFPFAFLHEEDGSIFTTPVNR